MHQRHGKASFYRPLQMLWPIPRFIIRIRNDRARSPRYALSS
jgi:hypothetical protein